MLTRQKAKKKLRAAINNVLGNAAFKVEPQGKTSLLMAEATGKIR